MSKKILIVGSARGIGLGLVKKFASHGYEVIGSCRKATDDLKNTIQHICEDVDLLDNTSASRLTAYLSKNGHTDLDTVIFNAGILDFETNKKLMGELEDKDFDEM